MNMSSISQHTRELVQAAGRYERSPVTLDSSIIARAGKLDDLLRKAGLTARLTFDSRSFLVGASPSGTKHVVEFVFASRDIYEKLVSSLRLYAFAKAFFEQKLNVVGSFADAVDVLYAINIASDRGRTLLERLKGFAFRLTKAVVPPIALRFESDAHYSMNAAAYSLFLDEFMQYTCGRFLAADDDINSAQANKFRMIEQLTEPHLGNLEGIKHLDIGCGWGGLIAYFEKNHATHSLGNTNSAKQKEYAEQQYGASVLLGDFSEIERLGDTYELITIVGMAEHLTPRRRSQLFRLAHTSLEQRGVLYFQCIARPLCWIGGDAYRLAYEDVFPGHYLESRGEMELRFAETGFEILYAADDAADYAKTTALWAKRLEANHQQIADIVGEQNFRIFLGYLAYASKLFASERGSLMRYMLRKTP
jgi:cyclopropane fatty-acyl-phospholipid synthase-like methyltransferase